MAKKLTTETFIQKAKKIHGDKFDYSKTIYEKINSKVTIICHTHGEFKQLIHNHLKGHGCDKCAREKSSRDRTLTQDQFIQKAKKTHGDKYDYSKVNYKNSKTKVKIFCNKHKEYFTQQPNNHLFGQGCPKCAAKIRSDKNKSLRLTKEQFIHLSKEKYKDQFNYDSVKYVNNRTNVKLYCNKHKIYFEVRPANHLSNGQCCPKCSYESMIKKSSYTTEQFIQKAKKIHGDKYDYSKVNYINDKTAVNLYCNEHKVYFDILPKYHFNGTGCPKCRIHSKGELKISNYLTKLKIKFIQEYRFEDCRYDKTLPFDFYLPDYNILIEYDGMQHFKPVELFGGENAFKYRQRNDKIKDDYCANNNIKLIRIPYNKYKEINHILSYNI